MPTRVAVIGALVPEVRRRVLRGRPRDAGHPHRQRKEPGRGVPVSRVHSVQGRPAARGEGARRGAPRPPTWGIDFGTPTIDVDKLRASQDRVVEKLDERHRPGGEAPEGGVTCRVARTLLGPTSIRAEADGGRRAAVEVDNIILATGSHPTRIPALAIDSPRVLDSTGALDLPEFRRRCW